MKLVYTIFAASLASATCGNKVAYEQVKTIERPTTIVQEVRTAPEIVVARPKVETVVIPEIVVPKPKIEAVVVPEVIVPKPKIERVSLYDVSVSKPMVEAVPIKEVIVEKPSIDCAAAKSTATAVPVGVAKERVCGGFRGPVLV